MGGIPNGIDANRLIFLDESGLKTNMTRLYGCAYGYAEIRKREADVLFLPAYSPDLNPTEKMWSKVKQVLRGIKARTEDALFTATGTALGSVTASDAQGWFESCSYIAFKS